MVKIPFDPLERAKQVEALVMKDLERKYYRFRYARYYGGIATADAVGCCFLCAYCWNYWRNLSPEAYGKFYEPDEVARNLLRIVKAKDVNKVRVSGAEPILGERSFKHLLKVMELIFSSNPRLEFIIETNGLVLGMYEEFVKELARFKRLFLRISIKGYDETSFERITGAKGSYFIYPLKALKFALKHGLNAWPACMADIFKAEGIDKLREKLLELEISPEELEMEFLERYDFVLKNLKERGIKL